MCRRAGSGLRCRRHPHPLPRVSPFFQTILEDRLAKFLGTMFVGCLLVTLVVWMLEIGPWLRRRAGRSTFFLLPWAPWKDYLACLAVLRERHREPRIVFRLFKWLSWMDLLCLLSFGLRLMVLRF